MKLDSQSLPLYAGVFVLLAAGAFFIARDLLRPAAPGASRAASAPARALAPPQVAAREAIRRGALDQARTLLEAVGPSDPAYLGVQLDLGVLHERAGRAEAALETAERILAAEPENPEAYFLRCRALYLREQPELAEPACLRALEIAPQHLAARYSLALIRLVQGRLDRSIDAYLRAMELDPEKSQLLDALKDLDTLARARPEFADPHYAMALFAGVLGSTEQEIVELESYLALAPAGGTAVEQARKKLEELRRKT